MIVGGVLAERGCSGCERCLYAFGVGIVDVVVGCKGVDMCLVCWRCLGVGDALSNEACNDWCDAFSGTEPAYRLGAVDCDDCELCEHFEDAKLFCVPRLPFDECEKCVLALDFGDRVKGAPDQVLQSSVLSCGGAMASEGVDMMLTALVEWLRL